MSLAVIEKLTALSDKNLMDIDKAKENGVKVAGLYCLYAPVELVVAAEAIPVSLCGTRNEPIAAAEKILPRNLCPLIKSSFGFAVTDSCPFFTCFRFGDCGNHVRRQEKDVRTLESLSPGAHHATASESGTG